MADVSIPREAVDAAARQIHTGYEHAAPIEQAHAREAAMDVLNAAAPLIAAAALDQFAAKLKQRADERDAVDSEDDADYTECEHGGDCHSDTAVATWIRAAWQAEHHAKQLRATE